MKNEQEVREAARKVSDSMAESEKERKGLFEELAKEIEQVNPALGGMEELAMLLSLPEESFALLAPVFLDELEKSFNNVNDQVAMAQTLNAAGIKIEDIQEDYVKIVDGLEEQLEGTISAQKINFLKQLLGITFNCMSETCGVAKKVLMIPIEFCHENAKMPTYAHLTDSGMDVYALEDITIKPGETKLIPTGIKVALPRGYEIQVRPKSGRTLKTKLRVGNAPGTVDASYRSELGVIIDNIEPFIKSADIDEEGRLTNVLYGSSYTIGKGEKFAQLVLAEVPKASFYEVDDVSQIGEDRGGGFGSTGLK